MLCYRLQLSLIRGFQCFLRHHSVLGLDCSIFCLLRHYSIYYKGLASNASLSVCYAIALFSASAVSSSICCVTIISSSLHCFVICLLSHCSILGFNCSIFCLLRHHTISSRFPLLHYLFVTSLLCSRLQLSPLLFVRLLYYFFKVSII